MPVPVGQSEIEDDHVGLVLLSHRDGLRSGPSLGDRPPRGIELQSNGEAQIGLIVDQKYLRLGEIHDSSSEWHSRIIGIANLQVESDRYRDTN